LFPIPPQVVLSPTWDRCGDLSFDPSGGRIDGMKRLPRVTAADLRGMKLSKLLAIRSIADDHFFYEMKKRAGRLEPDSPALRDARNLQALVQLELATQAEEERKARH